MQSTFFSGAASLPFCFWVWKEVLQQEWSSQRCTLRRHMPGCGTAWATSFLATVSKTMVLLYQNVWMQANVQSFKVMPSRSGTMRPWDQRLILDVFTNHTCAVALSGKADYVQRHADASVMMLVQVMTRSMLCVSVL